MGTTRFGGPFVLRSFAHFPPGSQIASDRSVGQHERAPLSLERRVTNLPQKKFCSLLGIADFAGSVDEVPSNLERVFYE